MSLLHHPTLCQTHGLTRYDIPLPGADSLGMQRSSLPRVSRHEVPQPKHNTIRGKIRKNKKKQMHYPLSYDFSLYCCPYSKIRQGAKHVQILKAGAVVLP